MEYALLEVKEVNKAKEVEALIYKALKPGGFADAQIPVPQLKDRLAWVSWSNLLREEQPTVLAFEGDKLVGVLVGEPIETTFDIGEAEIQDVICLPEFNNHEVVMNLMKLAIEFYETNGAKQIHVWCLKAEYDSKDMNLKCQVAIEEFGFAFKGFERVSKWSGKEIMKLEKNGEQAPI